MSKPKLISAVIAVLTIGFMFSSKANASTPSVRIAGIDRYGTAVEISKKGWDHSDNIVITTGLNFPDALSAAPLAGKLMAPILLVHGDRLEEEVKEELKRLSPQKAFIIGGTGVVSQEAEDEVISMGIQTERIGGKDRYETSVLVSKRLNDADKAAIMTGDDFPDALSMAPIAASLGIPMVLVPGNGSLPPSVSQYISDANIDKTYIIGGTDAVQNQIEEQLPNPERISGSGKYGTNSAVIERFKNELKFDIIYAATGEEFADALAGSALASLTSSPLILTSDNSDGVLKSTYRDKIIDSIVALGGEGALHSNIFSDLLSKLDTASDFTLGNTPGNIRNSGYAAEQGDYVYYFQYNIGETKYGSIYRMKKDGTEKVKLCDTGRGTSPFINVAGDWVYYYDTTGSNGSGGICKIKTDGTQKVQIAEDSASNINVAGNFIYYNKPIFTSDNKVNGIQIYRISTDGINKMVVKDSASILNIDGGYIYYIKGTELFRMKMDGTEEHKLGDGRNVTFVINDWMYYKVNDSKSHIQTYRTRLDGSGKTVLNDGMHIMNMNISDDYMYFVTYESGDSGISDIDLNPKAHSSKSISITNAKVNSVKIDGTGLREILDGMAVNPCTAGGYLYYLDFEDGKAVTYRIKQDGTGRENLSNISNGL